MFRVPLGLLLSSLIFLSAPAYARFGIIKSKATFQRYTPPPVYFPKGSTVSLEVSAVPQHRSWLIERQLGFLLKQDFENNVRDVRMQSDDGDFRIQAFVSVFRVDARYEDRMEEREVKVGEERYKDEKGRERVRDIYETRAVPVTYRLVNGAMSVDFKIQDRRGDQTCGAYSFSSAYSDERRVAEDADAAHYPGLVDTVSQDLARRIIDQWRSTYTWKGESVDVLLAVDDELKPGNNLALGGQWARARQFWQSLTLSDAKKDVARQYNLGASFEAQAYQTQDPLVAQSLLDQARALYERAALRDAHEKYFAEGIKRIQGSKNFYENLHAWQDTTTKTGLCGDARNMSP